MANNHFKFINLWQSSEERQGKYWLARSLGATPPHARRMRDWRKNKILRRFDLYEAVMERDDVTKA